MAWSKSTTTKHTCNGGEGPTFGRKTAGCPRCDELLAGAKPVQWGASVKAMQTTATLHAIRTHDCRASGCGPICVKFDW